MKEHPLIPLLQCPGVHVELHVQHTGDVDDLEITPLCFDEEHHSIFLGDGLYIVQEREEEADEIILHRLQRGELSGTHVFPNSAGFAHWHIELRGDTPDLS